MSTNPNHLPPLSLVLAGSADTAESRGHGPPGVYGTSLDIPHLPRNAPIRDETAGTMGVVRPRGRWRTSTRTRQCVAVM